ncbi:hypothetical protein ES703_85741 [subsurface metagenome]
MRGGASVYRLHSAAVNHQGSRQQGSRQQGSRQQGSEQQGSRQPDIKPRPSLSEIGLPPIPWLEPKPEKPKPEKQALNEDGMPVAY